MVSKLAFALQERVMAAAEAGEDPAAIAELADRYHLVRAGLGFAKSVAEQGTFPTDPHSHTPAHTGAQQPGMTGQVKEGVLLRWGELGVQVRDGRVRFRPMMLDPDEFLTEERPWAPLGEDGTLQPQTLGFTYCGIPPGPRRRLDHGALDRRHRDQRRRPTRAQRESGAVRPPGKHQPD